MDLIVGIIAVMDVGVVVVVGVNVLAMQSGRVYGVVTLFVAELGVSSIPFWTFWTITHNKRREQ
jgi:hypothetical protein